MDSSKALYNISIISKKPKKPKNGYKVFSREEKPTLLHNSAIVHIKIEKIKYCFLFLDILFKKLKPAEIAVVKIAIKIVKLNKYL